MLIFSKLGVCNLHFFASNPFNYVYYQPYVARWALLRIRCISNKNCVLSLSSKTKKVKVTFTSEFNDVQQANKFRQLSVSHPYNTFLQEMSFFICIILQKKMWLKNFAPFQMIDILFCQGLYPEKMKSQRVLPARNTTDAKWIICETSTLPHVHMRNGS